LICDEIDLANRAVTQDLPIALHKDVITIGDPILIVRSFS